MIDRPHREARYSEAYGSAEARTEHVAPTLGIGVHLIFVSTEAPIRRLPVTPDEADDHGDTPHLLVVDQRIGF